MTLCELVLLSVRGGYSVWCSPQLPSQPPFMFVGFHPEHQDDEASSLSLRRLLTLRCAECSFSTRTIEQSCSWACCPENKITVSLQSASTILKTCSPSLNITGLSDAVVSNGPIEIQNVSNNATQSATWNDGTLHVNLGDLMPTGRASAFHFTILVKNPNYPIPNSTAPTISMTARILGHDTCAGHITTGQTYAHAMELPSTACAVEHSASTCNIIESRTCNDSRPMFIRNTEFITHKIGQDNANPCAPTTITVCNPSLALSLPVM